MQLIDAASGGHVWAERYDRELEDIFVVQDEVTRRIVAALKVTLTGAERARRDDRGKVDAEAYDYLVRGRSCLAQFSAKSMLEARAMFEHALEIDPKMAPAYAWMAMLFGMEYVNGWNDAEPDHFKRALELAQGCAADDSEAVARHALGVALMWHRRLDGAQRELQRAIDLDPNLAEAYGVSGTSSTSPEITIEHTLRILPYANRAPLERFVDGLRKAGLAP